jgi:hypothetical protein
MRFEGHGSHISFRHRTIDWILRLVQFGIARQPRPRCDHPNSRSIISECAPTFRVRYEARNGICFGSAMAGNIFGACNSFNGQTSANGTPGKANDSYALQKTRLGFGHDLSPDVNFYLELQYASVWGANGQQGTPVQDNQRTQKIELYTLLDYMNRKPSLCLNYVPSTAARCNRNLRDTGNFGTRL